VGQIKAKYLKSVTSESKEVTTLVRGVKKLSKVVMVSTSAEQLTELRQVLQEKLSEIDEILS
jgi:isopentenyl diphosphate isomerase/L-lactate dehydrogenase-like FMN-dependent dehydrogenase